MLSLLGSLLGFGGSIIPGILDSFKKKQDQKYELRKLEVQAEINRENLEHQARLQKELGKQKIELIPSTSKRQRTRKINTTRYCITIRYGIYRWISKVSKTNHYICILSFIRSHRGYITLWCNTSGNGLSRCNQYIMGRGYQGNLCIIISFWFGSRAIDKNRSK